MHEHDIGYTTICDSDQYSGGERSRARLAAHPGLHVGLARRHGTGVRSGTFFGCRQRAGKRCWRSLITVTVVTAPTPCLMFLRRLSGLPQRSPKLQWVVVSNAGSSKCCRKAIDLGHEAMVNTAKLYVPVDHSRILLHRKLYKLETKGREVCLGS